jgi:hypothetical protein
MNTLTSVRLMEFNGKRAIDIREYYTNKANELCPTKKGVFIPIEHISELVTIIEQAEARYHEIVAEETKKAP